MKDKEKTYFGCEDEKISVTTDLKRKVKIDFISKTELHEDGLKEHWYTEMNGTFVSNSLSYDKDTARKFHDALILNGGKTVSVRILDTTEIEDKR